MPLPSRVSSGSSAEFGGRFSPGRPATPRCGAHPPATSIAASESEVASVGMMGGRSNFIVTMLSVPRVAGVQRLQDVTSEASGSIRCLAAARSCPFRRGGQSGHCVPRLNGASITPRQPRRHASARVRQPTRPDGWRIARSFFLTHAVRGPRQSPYIAPRAPHRPHQRHPLRCRGPAGRRGVAARPVGRPLRPARRQRRLHPAGQIRTVPGRRGFRQVVARPAVVRPRQPRHPAAQPVPPLRQPGRQIQALRVARPDANLPRRAAPGHRHQHRRPFSWTWDGFWKDGKVRAAQLLRIRTVCATRRASCSRSW